MKFIIDSPIEDYVRQGDRTTAEVLESNSSFIGAIREFDTFLRSELWTGEVEMSPSQAFLSMHGFLMYLSAVRVALSGHVAATFPLFRSSLESVCYAYLIKIDPSLEEVWASRHKDDDAIKKCRKRFTSAVGEVARLIADDQGDPSHAEWINDLYQSSIDFGAHPNPRAVFPHIREPIDDGESYIVALTGLYAADSFEVKRALMSCLDYALVLCVVLAHGLRSPSAALSARLFELNDLKERLAREEFDYPL